MCVYLFMWVHVHVCEQVSSSIALPCVWNRISHCFAWGSQPVHLRYWLASASLVLGLQLCAFSSSFLYACRDWTQLFTLVQQAFLSSLLLNAKWKGGSPCLKGSSQSKTKEKNVDSYESQYYYFFNGKSRVMPVKWRPLVRSMVPTHTEAQFSTSLLDSLIMLT